MILSYFFMHLFTICVSSLEKYLFSSFAHLLIGLFFLLLLICVNFLYILDSNHLSDLWFANIFSHSIGCLFILLIDFFAVQLYLLVYGFVACAFVVTSKNVLPWSISRSFSPIISSRNFMAYWKFFSYLSYLIRYLSYLKISFLSNGILCLNI